MGRLNSPLRPRAGLKKWLALLVNSLRRFRHRLRLGSRLKLGSNIHFGADCCFTPPNEMVLGNDVSFGRNVLVETDLIVGSETLVSSYVRFVGNDHAFDDPASTVYWQSRLPPSKVILEGDNLIGCGAIIIGNVTIKRGAIVGAGAIVTRDLPSGMICVGVPAKPVKPRWKI